jgi:hypothetical protein
MIVLLSCEPREVVDDDEVDLALVCAAVLQEILQLAAVGRLGALALLMEALKDARSCVGRLRFSVCSFVLTRT